MNQLSEKSNSLTIWLLPLFRTHVVIRDKEKNRLQFESENKSTERNRKIEKKSKVKGRVGKIWEKHPRNTHFAFKIPLIYVRSVVSPIQCSFHTIFSCISFQVYLFYFFFLHAATDKITEIVEIASEPLQSAAHK